LSATPDIGQPTRGVGAAAASDAAGTGATGAPSRRLGLALAVIATAQLMVVLDATIVNVALPHIQTALHFSGTNLEWVVNAYALAFGGLLLLGGRSGDLLGRRRIFIFGILLFSLASLLGGFATDQAWLLTARVVQGIGGAFAAPTALSLIAVTFPEGRQRNRAMGVYAAMSVSGAESFITSPRTPIFTASITSASSIAAVSSTVEQAMPASVSALINSRPVAPGMRRSSNRTSGRSRLRTLKAMSAS